MRRGEAFIRSEDGAAVAAGLEAAAGRAADLVPQALRHTEQVVPGDSAQPWLRLIIVRQTALLHGSS